MQLPTRAWPVPGNIQGQTGWGAGHPGLVRDVPAYGRGVGTRWFPRSFPTKAIVLSSAVCEIVEAIVEE